MKFIRGETKFVPGEMKSVSGEMKFIRGENEIILRQLIETPQSRLARSSPRMTRAYISACYRL
jgi:hypothetical protein